MTSGDDPSVASDGDDPSTASGRDDPSTASGRDDPSTASGRDDPSTASGRDDPSTASSGHDRSVASAGDASSSVGREPTVLLVEDNRGDVALVEHALEERALPGELHDVGTGEDALDWIAGRGEHADAPRPDLLLLDLNLPGRSGIEVLEELAAAPETRRLPVVVLTSTKSPGELQEAYAAGANACVRKPVDPETFAERIEAVVGFWLQTAELPSAHASGG